MILHDTAERNRRIGFDQYPEGMFGVDVSTTGRLLTIIARVFFIKFPTFFPEDQQLLCHDSVPTGFPSSTFRVQSEDRQRDQRISSSPYML
eukprot:742251-Pyramimonas_sp.AAC.2